VVHRVGIDCNSFEPRKILDKPQNLKLRLLSVARLVEKKGIKIAIEAVRQLVDDGMQISYRIAGDGPLMRELQNQVKRLALEPNITFLGQVPNSKIRDELSGTDLLIAPSVTAANGDMEGIPVTIMEAMAMEIPVVSTRHSGIPELIEDGLTGYLAQEGDIQSLYQKVKQASEENDKWPALGGSARTRILEDFNSRIQGRKLTELLKTIRERDDC
jgi:colanic acid/amylovoran biosynthesis glycosyltransferase